MKKLLALLILIASIPQVCVADEMKNKIEISITNIDKSKGGNLIVFIYKDDSFPSEEDGAIAKRTLKVHLSTQVVKISDNNFPEEIAIKVLHDEDANEKTTKNWTGIWPGEGLAYSNNQKLGILGAPSFEEAKIAKKLAMKGMIVSLDYP